jgi:hypothetical protein
MGMLIAYELVIERVDTLSVIVRVPEGTTPQEMLESPLTTIALAENMAKAVLGRTRHLIAVRAQ